MTVREDQVLDALGTDSEESVDARELPRARAAKDAKLRAAIESTLSLRGVQLAVNSRRHGVVAGELVGPLDAEGRAVIAAWGAGRVTVEVDDLVSATAVEVTRDAFRSIAERQRARFGKGGDHG